jgi:hypothetical protein
MRKATMCLLIALCSLAAFGQSQPQWKVVQYVSLAKQANNIPETTMFVPTAPGLYRMSGYLSVVGPAAGWELVVTWTDVTGLNSSSHLKVVANGPAVGQLGALIFVPKAGVPVAYSVTEQGNNPPSIYNVGIVIEQLQ